MKIKNFIFLSILIIIVLGLFFTNPTKNDHKIFVEEKLKEVVDKNIKKELEQNENLKPYGFLFKSLGSLATDQLSSEYYSSYFKTKDYYLFSTTEVLNKEKWEPIAIGVINEVYLLPKVQDKLDSLDIRKEIKEKLEL